MDLKLMDLEIRNFKGCESLSLPLDGRSASIYGDNAAGKTTVYDALTWLLFGKDSRGNGSFESQAVGRRRRGGGPWGGDGGLCDAAGGWRSGDTAQDLL